LETIYHLFVVGTVVSYNAANCSYNRIHWCVALPVYRPLERPKASAGLQLLQSHWLATMTCTGDPPIVDCVLSGNRRISTWPCI